MPSVPASAGVVAAMCAAMAVFTSSSGSARESCEIAGTYQGKATAKGLCPALDVALDVRGRQGPRCNVMGKATYNRSERDVECTKMEFDAYEGYTLEGRLNLLYDKDDFLGFYGRENCRVMRLRIFMQSGMCEVDLTKNQ